MATSQQWSDLPADVLSIIAKINFSDIHRLRFVCNSWRASLPPPPKPFSFPLKVPPPYPPKTRFICNWANCDDINLFKPTIKEDEFTIHEDTFYRLSPLSLTSTDPSDGWLFKASEANPNPNTFSLLGQLMKSVVNYPPGTLPFHLNLLDYRISEVRKCYALEMFTDPGDKRIGFRQVFGLWNYVVDCEFAAVFFRQDGLSANTTEMRVWKLGDKNWTTIDTKGYKNFQSLLVHDGKCYAVDRDGVLGYFDSELNLTVVCTPEISNRVIFESYLVEWESDLYMASKLFSGVGIERDIDFVIKLDKFDKCKRKWDSVGSIGPDAIVFLSDPGSFTASARDFKGCSGNKVYVVDSCFSDREDRTDFGVFDLENGRILRANKTPDYKRIFWPPSWLHV